MTDRPVTELFVALVDWVLSTGARNLDQIPGLWSGETEDWLVRCNAHRQEVDGMEPMTFELRHKTAFFGMAIVTPFDGALVGPTEDELIGHFRAAGQRHPQPPGVDNV